MGRHLITCKVKKEEDTRAAAGKNKKDVLKALKNGVPEDKEKRRKRYEEVMKLRNELRKDTKK